MHCIHLIHCRFPFTCLTTPPTVVCKKKRAALFLFLEKKWREEMGWEYWNSRLPNPRCVRMCTYTNRVEADLTGSVWAGLKLSGFKGNEPLMFEDRGSRLRNPEPNKLDYVAKRYWHPKVKTPEIAEQLFSKPGAIICCCKSHLSSVKAVGCRALLPYIHKNNITTADSLCLIRPRWQVANPVHPKGVGLVGVLELVKIFSAKVRKPFLWT